MSTETRTPRGSFSGQGSPRQASADRNRIANRQELTQFYRAIGIPAVASAMQAAKMTPPASPGPRDMPVFLRDAHG